MLPDSSDFRAHLSQDEAAFAARHPGPPERLEPQHFFARYAAELLVAARDPAVAAWHDANATISMCHRDTLVALLALASLTRGAIVEFGPYVGGTTVALARGARAAGGRVITVEKGGSYDHPTLPTTDILGDLRANLDRFGVAPSCDVIESDYSAAAAALAEKLGGRKIGVLVCDADGHFDRAMAAAGPFLAEDAVIVVDDYIAPFAPEKQNLTRPAIDEAVAAGEYTAWGLLSGVTWIGQRGTRPHDMAARFAEEPLAPEPLSDLRRLSGATGPLHAIRLPEAWRDWADDRTSNRSPLLLFEAGQLVGPAHSPHLDIAAKGRGAYSHWETRLWFSTRDNADPLTAARGFQIMLGAEGKGFRLRQANPHFDHDRVLWSDAYSGDYEPVRYEEQFDGQWKLFIEGKEGFVRHTGVDTSDPYIDDRIADLTGVEGFLERRKLGGFDRLKAALGLWKPKGGQGNRDIGGRLFLDPKFRIDHFRGKRCLDIGCGAGRWTRTLMTLGARVKSVDMSEHGLQSTRRFNTDVEKLDLFDILPQRPDLHEAFDFTLCWGVVMCTHDPLRAFENVVRTTKPGGEIYIMVYAPTYHASDYVLNARRRFHRECRTDQEKLDFVYELAGEDRANAINYLDMLNTFYNWTIDEATIQGWCKRFGLGEPVFLNADEPHKGAHHVLIRKPR